MPVIKSAKKKVRQDKKRAKQNKTYELAYKKAIDKLKKSSSTSNLKTLVSDAYSKIDRAVKQKVIHKKKASRLKSQLARLFSKAKQKSSK